MTRLHSVKNSDGHLARSDLRYIQRSHHVGDDVQTCASVTNVFWVANSNRSELVADHSAAFELAYAPSQTAQDSTE